MKLVKRVSAVEASRCVGCRLCEIHCPAGAIEVVQGLAREEIEEDAGGNSNRRTVIARIDENRCVACSKCEDICPHDAVKLKKRLEPRRIGIGPDDMEKHKEQIEKLLASLMMAKEAPVCVCTMTDAGELAAAVVMGARTPEDITAMTGIASGCGIYCQVKMLTMLRAYGVELIPPKHNRWYDVMVGYENITPEVDRRYPECRCSGDLDAIMKSISEQSGKNG